MQMLLFPDPRPLVERLGREFFRQTPECPGVYLMRDPAGTVLYVGKAKNLRRRLGSYRVANPERLARRHLRLLRAVAQIEVQPCPDEASALAREAALLRTLRPRFNRAGTWPGLPRFLVWRVSAEGLVLAVALAVEPGWSFHGPLGAGVFGLRATLVRLLWCAIHPQRGLAGMPAGWFCRRRGTERVTAQAAGKPAREPQQLSERVAIPRSQGGTADLEEAVGRLEALFAGQTEAFAAWIRARTAGQSHSFEAAVREADLETITEFAGFRLPNAPGVRTIGAA
jgi:predicted GIY-YIG superfamily endonuclease